MKLKLAIIIILTTLTNSYSQSKELQGQWILVRTLFSDGKRLEINNPLYSTSISYTIKPNLLDISGQKFKATFTDDKIIMPVRTLKYTIKENYLLAQDEGDNKTSYFLKVDDFIKKFPEFELKEVERNGEILYLDNHLSGYEFANELTYYEYMSRHTKDRDSKDFKNLYFKMEFILTKDNKVRDIKILNSIDKTFDEDYINVFNNAAKFFKNTSGKDLLIYKEADNLKWANDVYDKNEKKLYKLRGAGLNFYNENKFDKAIEQFSQIKNLDIKPNRFGSLIKESMIKLGISYLAVGKVQEACETFELVGDKTDFEIRNYLLDFCSK